jgi:hypothetical protein
MMVVAPKLMPVQVAELRLGATYVAPSGRLCRLAPPGRTEPASDGRTFVFEYLDAPPQPPRGFARGANKRGAWERESFSLARTNVGVLREVRR